MDLAFLMEEKQMSVKVVRSHGSIVILNFI